MKKLTIAFLMLVTFNINALAQSCLPEGITLTSQADIDNFQANYPGCNQIEGDVTIMGDNIANLNGLSVLTSIGGTLLMLYNNSLTSFSGLENLSSIGMGLDIDYNPALSSFTGLNNLASIGGYFLIYSNNSLTSLAGLNNLTSIGGYLNINSNPALTSLTGIENLTSVGDYLHIKSNPILTSLTALNNLTSIAGDLNITDNNALTSLNGLNNIVAGSIGNLNIHDNNLLSDCDVLSICSYLANPGLVDIYSNATGCDSQLEVEEACGLIFIESIPYFIEYSITPNPSPDYFTFSFTLKEPIELNLQILNMIGQVVANFKDEWVSERNHHITWDAGKFPPGIYFYRMTGILASTGTNIQITTGKMIVCR